MYKDSTEESNLNRGTFENFKSNVCHRVKYLGELGFIEEVLTSHFIDTLYDRKWYPECLYMLAMVDYLSRKNDVILYGGYNRLRCCKLSEIVYPSGIYMMYLLFDDESILKNAYENSIPEFKRYNIVENEVENIA